MTGPNAAWRSRRRLSILSFAAVLLISVVAGAGIASAGSGEVVVKKGHRGAPVAAIQKKLHLTADGIFGRQTHRAVKGFQKRRKLTADGVVGPQTRRALGLKPFARGSVRRVKRKRRIRRGDTEAMLEAIAECESGGDLRAIGGGGLYRGKYQFMRSTWKAWGGRTRDPAKASEREQDAVARRLYKAKGGAPWPNCP